MELIVTNTCFKRQNKFATYVYVGTVSAITCCYEDVSDDI